MRLREKKAFSHWRYAPVVSIYGILAYYSTKICYIETLTNEGIRNGSLLFCLANWGVILVTVSAWAWFYFKKREGSSRLAQAVDDKHSVEVYWSKEKIFIPFILLVSILMLSLYAALLSDVIMLIFGIFIFGGFYYAIKLLQILLHNRPALLFTRDFIQLGESQFPWNSINGLAIVAGPKAQGASRNVFLQFSARNSKGNQKKKNINISYLDVEIDVLAENLRRFAEVDTSHWQLYKPYFGKMPTDG